MFFSLLLCAFATHVRLLTAPLALNFLPEHVAAEIAADFGNLLKAFCTIFLDSAEGAAFLEVTVELIYELAEVGAAWAFADVLERVADRVERLADEGPRRVAAARRRAAGPPHVRGLPIKRRAEERGLVRKSRVQARPVPARAALRQKGGRVALRPEPAQGLYLFRGGAFQLRRFARSRPAG